MREQSIVCRTERDRLISGRTAVVSLGEGEGGGGMTYE